MSASIDGEGWYGHMHITTRKLTWKLSKLSALAQNVFSLSQKWSLAPLGSRVEKCASVEKAPSSKYKNRIAAPLDFSLRITFIHGNNKKPLGFSTSTTGLKH